MDEISFYGEPIIVHPYIALGASMSSLEKHDLVLAKADKGSSLVILHYQQYVAKIEHSLVASSTAKRRTQQDNKKSQ